MIRADGAMQPRSQFELDREGLVFASCCTFAKVMADNPDLARRFAERLLDIEIGSLALMETELTITSATRRSVRLDAVLASTGKVIEIEMQTSDGCELGRRLRQYQAMIDARLSTRGTAHPGLPELYMLCVCRYDEFGLGLPLYQVRSYVDGDHVVEYDNGVHVVIANTTADMSDTPDDVHALLQYVETNVPVEGDDLTMELAEATKRAYADEEWVGSVISYDMAMREAEYYARNEGRAEGRVEGEGRIAALAEAMRAAGAGDADIVAAITGPGLEGLYAKYGV